MLIDAHCHIHNQAFCQLLKDEQIQGIINCDSQAEYLQIKEWLGDKSHLTLSVGVHPWKADQANWQEMAHCFEQVNVIGEIGLDNEWCKVPMKLQKEVFERQLRYAMLQQKPVVLHTKGMEKDIAEIIQNYPNRYLVHWYSSLQYLEAYLAQDCYFTIGPSVYQDQAVQQVVAKVPLSRMLIESDGIAAIEWAINQKIPLSSYKKVLEQTLAYISAQKNISMSKLAHQFETNFQTFLGGRKNDD
ncbi:TatD family hydrolase [Isobaculum melis]|uniref:TatD DNase family protein n=1 Tax=Isobaculum melis TaxID=142588 RepID=A0A1H9UBY7_9LACT|nr:TatD family hydrolase [Isobaculum melis]SES06674.1 TatD DNase family protein [Isobaculum melis]